MALKEIYVVYLSFLFLNNTQRALHMRSDTNLAFFIN